MNHSSPLAARMAAGIFSIFAGSSGWPGAGGAKRNSPPYWSLAMMRPLPSVQRLTHEPCSPMGTEWSSSTLKSLSTLMRSSGVALFSLMAWPALAAGAFLAGCFLAGLASCAKAEARPSARVRAVRRSRCFINVRGSRAEAGRGGNWEMGVRVRKWESAGGVEVFSRLLAFSPAPAVHFCPGCFV